MPPAHFNLREEYLPYKRLIGRVILDKNPTLRTVVNKLDSIDTEFRYFAMEVLSGPADFIVTTSENNCSFTFDFSKVYWNSRLQAEHTRLVDTFEKEDVLADGFAGVGPFAVPAAKVKGCLGVFANDLNPMSAQALRENVKANKVGLLYSNLNCLSAKSLRCTGRKRRPMLQHGWRRVLPSSGPRSVSRSIHPIYKAQNLG